MSWRSLLYLLKWYRTFYLVEVGEGTGGVEKNAVWEGGGGGGGGGVVVKENAKTKIARTNQTKTKICTPRSYIKRVWMGIIKQKEYDVDWTRKNILHRKFPVRHILPSPQDQMNHP